MLKLKTSMSIKLAGFAAFVAFAAFSVYMYNMITATGSCQAQHLLDNYSKSQEVVHVCTTKSRAQVQTERRELSAAT